jgi:hypothetical protein
MMLPVRWSLSSAAICLVALFASCPIATPAPAPQDSSQNKSATEGIENISDPARRADRALFVAENSFNDARAAYDRGQIKLGDRHLDEMIQQLDLCLSALEAKHKSRSYKSAEIHVAGLMRRLRALIDDLSVDDRGWAEYTARRLADIHDKLLNGVMRK